MPFSAPNLTEHYITVNINRVTIILQTINGVNILMSIEEKARSLGNTLVESDEYKNLKTTEKAMYDNEEAKSLLEQFSTLQRRLQMIQANGKPVNEKQKNQLQALQARMQENEKVKAFMEAQQSFNKVMESVNKTITDILGGNPSSENQK